MGTQLSFDTHVTLTERTKTLGERIFRVESRVLETREERFASVTHTFDDGRVQCEVQFPFMGLGTPAQKQDVVVSRDDKHDFVDPVCGNDEGVVDLGEVFAVVDDANKTAADRVTGTIPREFRPCETGTIDDDVDVETFSKLSFLVEQVAVNGLGDEFRALGFDDLHEPGHGAVGIDDGSEMFVSVDDTVRWVDVVFDSKICVSIEPADTCLHDLLHLLVLFRVLFNLFAEKECGTFITDTRCERETRVFGNGTPNVVRLETPSFGVVQGNSVGMLTANGRRVFPQCTRDLRRKTLGLGMRCPFFGNDGDVVSAIQKDP